VLKLLSTLGVSSPTVRALAVFGIGFGAMRLLTPADLVEMTACSVTEAQTIVDGKSQ
jgi:hypothetical protein